MVFVRFIKLLMRKDKAVVTWSRKNIDIRTNSKIDSLCLYGIDEYFMNCYVLPEWLKNKLTILSTRLNMHLRDMHYEFYKIISLKNLQPKPYKFLHTQLLRFIKDTKLNVSKDIQSYPYKILKYIDDLLYNPKCSLKLFNKLNEDIVFFNLYYKLLYSLYHSKLFEYHNIECLEVDKSFLTFIDNKYIINRYPYKS